MKKLIPRDHRGHSKERDNKYISPVMQLHELRDSIIQAKCHSPKLPSIELEFVNDADVVLTHMGLIRMNIGLGNERNAEIEASI